MKLIAIILIVLGLAGIALNIFMLPTIEAPVDQSQDFLIGYYIGVSAPATIGLILILIGGVLYKKIARKQRQNSSGGFSL